MNSCLDKILIFLVKKIFMCNDYIIIGLLEVYMRKDTSTIHILEAYLNLVRVKK